MQLGILETGSPPRSLDGWGGYADMFRKLLGEDAYGYRRFDVQAGELPEAADTCPAYLITGSASGVYDGDAWIGELKRFLRAAKGKAALVGICFGHQIMAEAFGGKVIQSPKGWGVGLHEYRAQSAEPWLDGATHVRLPASHRDQVVEAPPGARVVAASGFAPFGMLAYDDQPAISLQLHPEFAPDYATALVEKQRNRPLSDEETDRAIVSLRQPDDRIAAAGWIRAFLAGAAA